jgi:hypothetical protein
VDRDVAGDQSADGRAQKRYHLLDYRIKCQTNRAADQSGGCYRSQIDESPNRIVRTQATCLKASSLHEIVLKLVGGQRPKLRSKRDCKMPLNQKKTSFLWPKTNFSATKTTFSVSLARVWGSRLISVP